MNVLLRIFLFCFRVRLTSEFNVRDRRFFFKFFDVDNRARCFRAAIRVVKTFVSRSNETIATVFFSISCFIFACRCLSQPGKTRIELRAYIIAIDTKFSNFDFIHMLYSVISICILC